jgi:hypothetical protein
VIRSTEQFWKDEFHGFSKLDEAHQHMGTKEANDGLLESPLLVDLLILI